MQHNNVRKEAEQFLNVIFTNFPLLTVQRRRQTHLGPRAQVGHKQ